MPDHASLLNDINAIIEKTGRDIIMPAFRDRIVSTSKADGSVVTETDTACQRFIERQLAALAPDIAFLGEEMNESEQQSCLNDGGRFWCLDPLDGTTNFVAGIPVFATSLALIEDGRPVLSWIHDPVRRESFTAVAGQGARLDGRPIRSACEKELATSVGYIDYKRLRRDAIEALLQRGLYRSQRNLGTCALEWAWLAAGRGHFIIHGGEKLWDFAAGSLIATEAGCRAGDFSGHALFPRRSLTSPILATCGATIQNRLLEQLAGRSP